MFCSQGPRLNPLRSSLFLSLCRQHHHCVSAASASMGLWPGHHDKSAQSHLHRRHDSGRGHVPAIVVDLGRRPRHAGLHAVVCAAGRAHRAATIRLYVSGTLALDLRASLW